MPVRVFTGDDTISMRRGVALEISQGEFEPVDIERYNANTTAAAEIVMAVGTSGLFAARRLVLVEGVGLEKKERGKSRAKSTPEDHVLTLEKLVNATTDTTTVIVMLAGIRADSRVLKDVAVLAKEGRITSQAFPAPKAKDMAGWLQQYARTAGIRMEPKASVQLALRVGDRVALADTELNKLATAAGPDGVITEHLVGELVAPTVEDSVFPLIDAIALRQVERAFGLLAKQLGQSHGADDPSLPILNLVARQMRILLLIKLLTAAGRNRSEIITTTKIPEYYADRYFSQAERLSEAQLAAAMERLAATDQAIKNGDAGPAALQLLIAELTRTQAAAWASQGRDGASE
jgi:DNA polymerase-3 subunit delta